MKQKKRVEEGGQKGRGGGCYLSVRRGMCGREGIRGGGRKEPTNNLFCFNCVCIVLRWKKLLRNQKLTGSPGWKLAGRGRVMVDEIGIFADLSTNTTTTCAWWSIWTLCCGVCVCVFLWVLYGVLIWQNSLAHALKSNQLWHMVATHFILFSLLKLSEHIYIYKYKSSS